MLLAETSFAQNLALLAITALLTGLVVPYILKTVEYRKGAAQQEGEAALKRQAEILDAQSKFLDDLSSQLWRWRYLSMKVAYYGRTGSDEQHQQAFQEYDGAVWDSLNELRSQVSRARRLVSEQAFSRLLEMYEQTIVTLDQQLSEARTLDKDSERRERLMDLNSYIFGPVTKGIDALLDELAAEMKLKA